MFAQQAGVFEAVRTRGTWQSAILAALLAYVLSGVLAVASCSIFLRARSDLKNHGLDFERYDTEHYRTIATRGYSYDAEARSNIAFFPLFPLTARALHELTGLSVRVCLWVTAHTALFLALTALAAYLVHRHTDVSQPNLIAGGGHRWMREPRLAAVLCLAFFPTTFFLRLAYSESLFLLLMLLAFIGFERRWSVITVAWFVGLLTMARPVGMALVPPFCCYAYHRLQGKRWRVAVVASLIPLATWGLLSYMIFQYMAFGEPLAFAQTQTHWRWRPEVPGDAKALALLSFEPVWSVYLPSSVVHWSRTGDPDSWWLNLSFANPIYFCATGALVAIGAWKSWLTRYEVLASVCLLGIPYLTRAHETGMISHARFASLVFPAYIVLGHCLARMPATLAWCALFGGGVLMGIYLALFAMGYSFF